MDAFELAGQVDEVTRKRAAQIREVQQWRDAAEASKRDYPNDTKRYAYYIDVANGLAEEYGL